MGQKSNTLRQLRIKYVQIDSKQEMEQQKIEELKQQKRSNISGPQLDILDEFLSLAYIFQSSY